MKKRLFQLIVLLTLAACTSTQPAPTSTPISPTNTSPPPTDTSLPPTDTSLPPTQLPPQFEVTFDGKGCISTVPAELPVGKISIIYKDLTENNIDLWVGSFVEGRTYQDLLDSQSEPGEYIPDRGWTSDSPKFEQKWNDSLGGEVYVFYLHKEGEHYIVAGRYPPQGSFWFCAPLTVVEPPSQ